MLALNTTNLFADIGSRGRYSDFSDSNSNLEDLFMPIVAVILTIVGAILCYVSFGEKDKNNKGMGCWGCVSFIVGIGGLILLVRSCAN